MRDIHSPLSDRTMVQNQGRVLHRIVIKRNDNFAIILTANMIWEFMGISYTSQFSFSMTTLLKTR